MTEQGYEEGVDWDFFYYVDSWKQFAPLCSGEAECDLEGKEKPSEEFIVY